MQESKYITEEDYFICSDGLMPARLQSTQNIAKQSNKFKHITVAHTATHSYGDFGCRWAMVLAAAIATLAVLTGGAALAVAAAAVAVVGGLLCGHLMASGRKWDKSSQLFLILGANTVDAKLMMRCSIGGVIRVAPGCNSFWKACLIGVKNTVLAGLEGIAVGATIYYGGKMIAERSFATFLPNLAKNYAKTWTTPLGWVGRGIGGANKAFDNYFVEGMDGAESWEDAWKGGLVVETPIYNLADNAIDPKKSNRWQDYYYAGLTVGSLGLIPPQKFDEANTRFVNGLKNMAKKAGRFFNWTKSKTVVIPDAKTMPHEIIQARKIGDMLGGGEFKFEPSKQGVEGYLTKPDGTKVPISLKDMLNTNNMKNVLRTIRENGKHIAKEAGVDTRIKTGKNPNSVLYGDVPFTEGEVITHMETAKPNALPQTDIFQDIYIGTSDGKVVRIPQSTPGIPQPTSEIPQSTPGIPQSTPGIPPIPIYKGSDDNTSNEIIPK